MARPTLEAGFKFWREEVDSQESPEKSATYYIPAAALVGIYTVSVVDVAVHTSYHWRQAVLQSDEAMTGFRRSLTSAFRASST